VIIRIGDSNACKDVEKQIIKLACNYAFTELNLFRIEINVASYDTNTKIALEESGFLKEITYREYLFFYGHYWDDYLYGILKPEWVKFEKDVQL
jgi:RimJ/RimL family protein N-acetyltransferase